MAVLVALLRGINVGGHTLVRMAALKALFEAEGFTSVGTILQSGNVVFDARKAKRAGLERKLEAAIEAALEVRVTVILRSPEEIAAAVKRNPFPAEAKDDPGHLVLMCLDRTPEKDALAALLAAHKGPERIVLDGADLFITYPAGIGTSKLTNTLIEKKLGVRGTARNWRTVARLIEAAENLAG